MSERLYLNDEEVRRLYEVVAEEKSQEALEIIYEACGDRLGLLYPTTQLRAVELRK